MRSSASVVDYEALTPVDVSFLRAESPVSHMHVGQLAIFENRDLSEATLMRHIERRLHFVPRFRKKLAWVSRSFTGPVWVDDPHFDLRFHVRYTGLPRPAGEREALMLTGRVMSRPLDRQRPLWELWVFELPDDRIALLHKTHFCLIDGLSGVDLGTVMLDLTRQPPQEEDPPPWRPRPGPARERLLLDAVVNRIPRPSDVIHTLGSLAKVPRNVAGRASALGREVLTRRPSRGASISAPSLSEPIGAHRRFEIVRAPLDDVKEIKNRFDCTVNDVVLALVTGGLRKLLDGRGEAAPGVVLQAMVPVSVRDYSDETTYGNTVSMVTADLPVGEASARRRLELLRGSMAVHMRSKQAVGADFWVKLSEYASPTMLGLAGRATAFRKSPVHVTITNVPGPESPLFLQGRQLIEAFPCVPIAGTTSLGVAVLSYDGKLQFGLTGDWDATPDLETLAVGIQESLRELRDIARPGRLEDARRSPANA